MATTRKTYKHPEWLKAGATVYMVNTRLEPTPCTVLEPPVRRCGTVRLLLLTPDSPLPWTVSGDQIHQTESLAWAAAARQLDRRAAVLRNDAAHLEARAMAAHNRSLLANGRQEAAAAR